MASKKIDDKQFDIRTVDFHLSHGSLKPADYQKYLSSLPDEEGNYVQVNLEEEEEAEETLTWSDEGSLEALLPEDNKD